LSAGNDSTRHKSEINIGNNTIRYTYTDKRGEGEKRLKYRKRKKNNIRISEPELVLR